MTQAVWIYVGVFFGVIAPIGAVLFFRGANPPKTEVMSYEERIKIMDMVG